MKKTLIALMTLAGVASAGSLTLDSKYMAEGVDSSYFSGFTSTSGVERKNLTAPTITFYVEISDLLGSSAMLDNSIYDLTSLSWYAYSDGSYVGGSRQVTLSNGTQTLTLAHSSAATGSDKILTVNHDLGFIVTKETKLTITLSSTSSNENVSMGVGDRSTDAAKAATVTGATFGYVNGEPVYNKVTGVEGYTPIQSSWAYNDIPLQLTLIPEPATATLSLLALAGLAARRRLK